MVSAYSICVGWWNNIFSVAMATRCLAAEQRRSRTNGTLALLDGRLGGQPVPSQPLGLTEVILAYCNSSIGWLGDALLGLRATSALCTVARAIAHSSRPVPARRSPFAVCSRGFLHSARAEFGARCSTTARAAVPSWACASAPRCAPCAPPLLLLPGR